MQTGIVAAFTAKSVCNRDHRLKDDGLVSLNHVGGALCNLGRILEMWHLDLMGLGKQLTAHYLGMKWSEHEDGSLHELHDARNLQEEGDREDIRVDAAGGSGLGMCWSCVFTVTIGVGTDHTMGTVITSSSYPSTRQLPCTHTQI